MRVPLPLETIVAKRLCTGCGACSAMTDGRIQMRETEDCNRRPDFSAFPQGLTDPGIAAQCPAQETIDRSLDTTETEVRFGPVLGVYEGYATDPDIRFRGSSGGAVTALALASLDGETTSGVLHIKASPTDPAVNEAAISRSRDSLLEGAGSRYGPASIADALPKIVKETGETTLIGKPCDISGARAVADSNPMIAASIGAKIAIFCAGTPSHKGTKQLLKRLDASEEKLDELRYRGNGWPGTMMARWRSKCGETRSAEISYEEGWGEILQQYRQWRCYICADHTGEEADLSVGDPWQRPSGEDGHGRSLIIVRTHRGQRLLERAIEAGHISAQRVEDEILGKAQPNLVAAKGNVFGRSVALKLMGLPAPTFRLDTWACWLGLTVREKIASIAGTLRRIPKKKLLDNHQIVWRQPATPAPDASQSQ